MHATATDVSYPLDTPTAVLAGNPFYSLLAPPTPSIETLPLADGTAGTYQTLEAMASCVRGECPPDFCGYQDEAIRKFAQHLANRALTSREEIKALFDFVARQIKYLAHPMDQQIVQDACRTIQFKTGDCVSLSVLLATLLAALDYPVKFIAQYPSDKTGYSHVYVLTQDESGNEIRLDPVAKDEAMGWSQKLPDGGFETSFDIFRD